MNLINAKYGSEPGLKAYTHLSDQFGPFATQNIPATVNEAPYILDGLLMNDTGRRIKEQYADIGGFTDLVFAATSLLSYRFIPRIRDLPSKRLYLFDPTSAPEELRSLIGGKVREGLIIQNWPDVLRTVATIAAGIMPPSQLLKKFASYPRQHELALALRENLLAAIIIYWNTKHLGQATKARNRAGLDCSPQLLSHISPLGWAHILLTGEYRWKNQSTKLL